MNKAYMAIIETFFEAHPHVLQGDHVKYVRVAGAEEPDLRLDTPAMILFLRWSLDNRLPGDVKGTRQFLAHLEREWYGRRCS